MTTIEQAKAAWQQATESYIIKSPSRVAYMGNNLGNAASNVIVPGLPNHIYARDSLNSGNYYIVQNRSVQPAVDKPVILGFIQHEPDIEQVLDFHYAGFEYSDSTSTHKSPVNHGQTHMFGGGDEVFIDGRLFMPGLMRPTNPPSTSTYVEPFVYYYKQWSRFPGGSTPSLSQYIPTSGSRYVTIAVDPESNDLVVRPGVVYTTAGSGLFPGVVGNLDNVPQPAGDEYPIGSVNLADNTVVIEWSNSNDMIFDSRLHIGAPYHEIINRLEGVEGYLGLGKEQTLPATGAAEQFDEFRANADLLQSVHVATTAPTDGQSLVYQQSQNAWAPSTITGGAGGGGEVNTGSNVGTGFPVYRENSSVNLIFRTLVGGDNTTLTSNASIITIAGTDSSNAAVNLGTGLGVFHETAGGSHQFKSLIAGTNTTLASNTSAITINAVDNSAITSAVNLGSGIPVFHEISASTLLFRSLSAGVNIDIKEATSTVNISPPERHFNTLIQAPRVQNSTSAWNNLTIPIWQAPKASGIELNQFNVALNGPDSAASLSFALEKRDWGSIGTQGTSILSASQNATFGGVEATTFNGNASLMVSKQHMMFVTGSGAASGGTVDFLSLTGYYNFTSTSPAVSVTPLTGSNLLLETGDAALLEIGDFILLETPPLLLVEAGSILLTEAGTSIVALG